MGGAKPASFTRDVGESAGRFALVRIPPGPLRDGLLLFRHHCFEGRIQLRAAIVCRRRLTWFPFGLRDRRGCLLDRAANGLRDMLRTPLRQIGAADQAGRVLQISDRSRGGVRHHRRTAVIKGRNDLAVDLDGRIDVLRRIVGHVSGSGRVGGLHP